MPKTQRPKNRTFPIVALRNQLIDKKLYVLIIQAQFFFIKHDVFSDSEIHVVNKTKPGVNSNVLDVYQPELLPVGEKIVQMDIQMHKTLIP